MSASSDHPLAVEQAILQTRRWESPSRYYSAVVQQNLFGDWELLRIWGGLNSRLGSFKVKPAANREEALSMLEQEGARRNRRGYTAIGPGTQDRVSTTTAPSN